MGCSQRKEGWNGSEGMRDEANEVENEKEREGREDEYTYTLRCESSQRAGITRLMYSFSAVIMGAEAILG